MVTLRSKKRFDDVGELRADGFYEYVYRGYYYELASDECVFFVRTYDDEPGVAIVSKPTDALARPEARELVNFITEDMGCTTVRFYAPDGGYRPVDTATLEFEGSRRTNRCTRAE